ncbi:MULTISPECIES: sulfite oxidase-like oxidoreductase [Microbacterium]|uniref:Sulfite oxidase-like oxidoreductase n=1 Tax=Microbacterium wangchenii TaxID=2541726 RepID=A0ABX5ST55_9MICO|nr:MULTISPECIES: sulfite oxidase-like oxidoreductase [Microbacterium]MCK6067742.1 sulfite oxidase-like oxidoreductase [Microbacterium sp. EYE_512]QBR89348.1 sulfite oxidase-like oxidoreductase [Microbacterium wangchenii]TFV81587.1 sulfite oxidase-like oxidoreductase [Microbacterium sp. dk485]TXK11021.1 sulfite oxidase-like oxidoreductase [Microbacterium wangchenii]
MAVFSRGFGARRRESAPDLPPGQYLTEDFPVLSAGPTPRIPTDEWSFTIRNEHGAARTWTWDEFLALPIEEVATDIHCVTRWSKLGTSWRGVSLDTLLAEVETEYEYAMAHSYGGYTTNVPLEDLTDGKAWVAFEFDGAPLDPEHGGPARLLVPHLYFWKSAKWVRGLTMQNHDDPGFWEQNGYHLHGDPWREERYW